MMRLTRLAHPRRQPGRRRDLIVAVSFTLVLATGLLISVAVYAFPLNQTTYTALMRNTGGLEPGDQVRVAGTRVGKVSSVQLTGTHITVQFRVENGVRVTAEASTSVKLTTPIGGRVLDVDPGMGETKLVDPIPLVRTTTAYDISSTLETTTPVFRDVSGVDLRKTAELLQDGFSDGNTYIPDALRNTSQLMDLLQGQYQRLDQAVELSDEYLLTLADRKEDLADFLSQLSFLASTLGPDIQNVQSGFNYLKRLFALLTRPLVAYQAGIEPSVQEFKELLAKVEGRLPDYYNALNQVDEITRRLETVLGVPTESAQETGEMIQVCIPTPGAIC